MKGIRGVFKKVRKSRKGNKRCVNQMKATVKKTQKIDTKGGKKQEVKENHVVCCFFLLFVVLFLFFGLVVSCLFQAYPGEFKYET